MAPALPLPAPPLDGPVVELVLPPHAATTPARTPSPASNPHILLRDGMMALL
jgi:hypothetical protein